MKVTIIRHTLGLLLLACMAISCTDPIEKVGHLTMSQSMLQIAELESATLTAYDADGDAVKATWCSSADSIVSVDANGVVTAHTAGTAIVTASCGKASAECVVLVQAIDLSKYSRMPRSKKRGVSFNFTFDRDVELLQRGVSWSYNWGPDAFMVNLFQQYGMTFCPMIWNANFSESRIANYVAADPSCEYLLAFNEPNLKDQANMTPQKAAEEWPRVKAVADRLGLKIVSPAMNYGTLENYSDPIKWLDEFFALVPLSDVDAIAIHCYMPNATSVKNYVERFRKYGKPIWMTEFCAWDGFQAKDPEPQIRFMSEVLNYFEKEELVERYAWFMPRGSAGFPFYELLTHQVPSDLTDAGKVYVGISSLDKTFYHTTDMILAQEYNDLSDEHFPQVGISTDVGGELDVNAFYLTMWLDYQVEATGKEKTLELRYKPIFASTCTVLVDGVEVATIELPKTDNQWATISAPVALQSGKHTVRLRMDKGNISLHWLRFVEG